ncbi:MAG TPA: SIR2 family protein [Thermoanaerobaculia bacterium]|jgi:tetratricopeptide (TPR) repeat protein|nr:SIR2 family protein [Thermoanaerobaculia bacterium]
MAESPQEKSPSFGEFLAYKLHAKPRKDAREQLSRNLLLRALEQETTIAFLGAGVSVPFGYPNWKELGRDVFDYALEKLPGEGPLSGCRDYIRSLKIEAGRLGDKAEADALMFMIGACKSALSLVPDGLQGYYDLFRENFSTAKSSGCGNVFQALLELPIHRFVTTNYDREIENALGDIRKSLVGDKSFIFDAKPDSEEYRCRRSLTQRPEDLGQLTLFALARARGNENMIFHCHGRYDEPELIVATEADYQKWYLSREAGAANAFQQSAELLLGSNPLLFIGYSLRDDDLLRPLRQLSVLDPAQKETRPIFALVERSEESERDLVDHGVLFERYGLHVIPYERRSSDKAKNLEIALEKLRENLGEARQKWSEKPFLKRPDKPPELPKPYCEIEPTPDIPVKPLERLDKEIRFPGIVVLEGPSGSGKTYHALTLTKRPDLSKVFKGIFYWNAHYGNEAMTALDHALAYLDPERKFKGTRHERIRECLQKKPFLLILDGCERLLRKTDNPREGITYSVTFRRLLKAFANPDNRSTVVLATRLWPIDLDLLQSEKGGRPFIRRLFVSRVEAADLHGIEPFASLLNGRPREDAQRNQQMKLEISALCSLLRGHNYGLFLAGRYLQGREDPLQTLQELNQNLAKRHRDERLQEMINLQVLRVDRNQRAGPARVFLETLSAFLGPVSEQTLTICFEEACPRPDKGCNPKQPLIDAGLLFPMHPPIREAETTEIATYTVHCTARNVLLRSRQGPPTDPLPAFGLSGCTCGRLGVNPDPDPARRSRLRRIFDRILEAAASSLAEGDRKTARALCRDAFSLVRTGMEANTAPRWCTYEEYLQFPLAVAILAKRVTSGCWTYCEHADAFDLAEREDSSLYPAELAWLYNDIALALSGSGYIHDACSFLEQAFEVSRLIEHPAEGGGFHLEVLLSLAFTLIEMGKLSAAGRHLDDAERLARQVPDDDFAARILGLRGLMLHLRGDLLGADDYYDRCLKLLRSGVNLRAQSIFLKHKADVKISMQELEEADLLIRNSRALAESGVFPELVANARISEGHRLTRSGQPVKARLEYTAVLREAQRIGFRKLEVRALTALARLALDQKDADGGRDLAMRALTLANQFGLGLRQSHALVVLGLATLEMGQSDLGVAYLRSAKRLADDQGYWSRSREAENKLLELGLSPTSENRGSATR